MHAEDTILYTDLNVKTGQIQRMPYYTDLKGRVFYTLHRRNLYFIQKDFALYTEDTILYTDPKATTGQIKKQTNKQTKKQKNKKQKRRIILLT